MGIYTNLNSNTQHNQVKEANYIKVIIIRSDIYSNK